jgi:hypothetical protein
MRWTTFGMFVLFSLAALANDKSFGAWGGSGQPCTVVTIDDQASYQRGQSLGVRVFAHAPDDKVGPKVAEELVKVLGKSKFFRTVTLLGSGSAEAVDYILDGDFLTFQRGDLALRATLPGEGSARLWLWLTLRRGSDPALRIAVIDCDSDRAVTMGSLFTVGKLVGGRLSAKIHQVAESLAKQFTLAEVTIQARATRKQPKALYGETDEPHRTGFFGRVKNAAVAVPKALPLPGKGRDSDDESAGETADQDGEQRRAGSEQEDDNPEIKSVRRAFASLRAEATAGRRGPRRVEAVLVNARSWQAFRRLADDPSSETPEARRELGKGLAQAKPHLEKAAGQGLLVFLISYEKVTWYGPILWNTAEVEKSISLRDAETNESVRPALFVDEAADPCVRTGIFYSTRTLMVAFPLKGQNGQAWRPDVKAVDLHAEIEGVPIALRFKLPHASAGGLEALALP